MSVNLGLTGGIGCGKSTAGRFLEEAGFRRIDTDAVVRDLLAGDEAVQAAVRARFGDGVIGEDGSVLRAELAKVVFAEEAALRALEAILHPRVHETWLKAAEAGLESPLVVEIPLLFEKRLEKHFDFTVCVFSSVDVQLKRLAAKGYSREQAIARMERQMPLGSKVALADFVLLNDGELGFLKSQIEHLIPLLTQSPRLAS